MPYLRSRRPNLSRIPDFLTLASKKLRRTAAVMTTFLLAALMCFAQNQPKSSEESAPPPGPQGDTESSMVTIPAGTHLALVLTHPVQSRYIHHGDDIYAQTTSPVDSGNEVVIPASTFVQGKVDRLERKGGRGEIRLQSMAITFPDGYVVPISGPITLVSNDGYALKDPGQGRFAGAMALPAAGAGLGALIGHAAGNSQPSTITNTLPPGCTGPPPGCLSSSMTVPGSAAKSTLIGAAVGGAVGGVASVALLLGSHNFFLDVWSPVEMVLERPITLRQNEVTDAVRKSEQHPIAAPPIAPRPLPPPPPDMPIEHGTCYTPGTPPTVIPGTPDPDGVPGPPTVIPGTPPTPGTPYPCP